MGKILTAYYSHSGNTEKLARMIAELTGAKLVEIVPEKPYPSDYHTVVEQAKREIGAGFLPGIETAVPDMEGYDALFLGTPNWWSTLAPPAAAFLKAALKSGFKGKKAAVFCTHGGGGFGHLEKDAARLCPEIEFLPGFSSYEDSASRQAVKEWLQKIGLSE